MDSVSRLAQARLVKVAEYNVTGNNNDSSGVSHNRVSAPAVMEREEREKKSDCRVISVILARSLSFQTSQPFVDINHERQQQANIMPTATEVRAKGGRKIPTCVSVANLRTQVRASGAKRSKRRVRVK
eukprot:scaffold6502_cov38-Cyclotella_meneghiniana.AAC.2